MDLQKRYAMDRDRLLLLSEADTPAGEYASPVFGDGNPSAATVLIGEAPGAEETRQGRPFVGKAGRHLDSLLERAGIDRADVYTTNVVKYRPVVRSERSVRNRTPNPREIAAALPLLRDELLAIAPKTVVTLGNVPLRAVLQLCGLEADTIGALHGRPIPAALGSIHFTLFALYHPASGIYNRALLDVMERDAISLGEHLVKPS